VTASKTTTTTRHYTDGSDNPAWIETARPDGTSETLRYTSSISGDLGASIATDGGTSLMLSNIHGDTVTTIPIPAGTPGTTAATTIAGWSSYTEYGTPIDPAQTAAVGTSAGYGWLGSKERSTTTETAGLTLMGVRFYNQVTGAFTSLDPIAGGNATAYNYPTDPVNSFDLNGRESKANRAKRHAVTAATCASLGRPRCAVATGATVTASKVAGRFANDNMANAVRHFIWMGLLYFSVGKSAAKRLGDAHEYGLATNGTAKERKDSARDKANNKFSLNYFSSHEGYVKSAQRKSGLSTPKYLRKLAIKLYNKGYFARV